MKVAALVGVLSVLVAMVVARGAEPSFDPPGDARVLAPVSVPPTTPAGADGEAGGERGRRTATVSTAEPVTTLPVRSAEPASRSDEAPEPLRVVVPALDLDVDVVSVGVDDDGLFDVPRADQVGWYRYGAAPGDEGAAVLAAHVDFNGRAGAFFALQEVASGDVIRVDFSDGTSRSFEVVQQTLYDKTALPADELFRRRGEPILHLATCGGTFDPVSRSYLGNRVVSAVPVETIR